MKRERQLTISVIGPSTRFLSGISYYTIRLCNALSLKNQVNAMLFRNMLPKRLFPGWKRIGQTGVNVCISNQVNIYEILDWYNPFSWASCARVIRKSDVTILEWWTSSVAHMYLALILLSGKKTRFIIEFHEVVDPLEYAILPIRLYAKSMGRIIRNAAKKYVVHSEHDRHLIASQYDIHPADICVIPHGLYDHYPVLDKEASKQKLGVSGRCIFLFFGLLRPYKGVSFLIEAFEKLPSQIQNESVLIIAGEAWEDQESITRIEQSFVRVKIILDNRYLADTDIPDIFSAADILVLPYTRASQSGVAHIGIAYGLPIIASNVGGLTESLGTYDGTTFIEPSDVPGLSNAMTDLFLHRPTKPYSPPHDMKWEEIANRYTNEIVS